MPKDDIVRLRHILDAARKVLSFISGKARVDLNANRMLVLSLVKEVEIIGEAAEISPGRNENKYKGNTLAGHD